jgi:hypothetical protein
MRFRFFRQTTLKNRRRFCFAIAMPLQTALARGATLAISPIVRLYWEIAFNAASG